MTDMDYERSTVGRGHLNVLWWPVNGGFFAYAAIAPGTCFQGRGESFEQLNERVPELIRQMQDEIDRIREDHTETYRECMPLLRKPVKMIQLPAAPPYLGPGVLDHFVEKAYTTGG